MVFDAKSYDSPSGSISIAPAVKQNPVRRGEEEKNMTSWGTCMISCRKSTHDCRAAFTRVAGRRRATSLLHGSALVGG